MKLKIIVSAVFVVFITNAYAKPPASRTKNVNVVNTPNVTVANPQTMVTVNNGTSNPIPVAGAVTVSGMVTVDNTNPIPVNVQNAQSSAPGVQFVGFTGAFFTGNTGIVEFTRECNRFSAGSRMCTSEEIMNTNTMPLPPALPGSLLAWVRPVLKPGGAFAADASGVSAVTPADLSCSGWRESANTGLTISSSGGFDAVACTFNIPVACCAIAP